jgi:hypothetical protein
LSFFVEGVVMCGALYKARIFSTPARSISIRQTRNKEMRVEFLIS